MSQWETTTQMAEPWNPRSPYQDLEQKLGAVAIKEPLTDLNQGQAETYHNYTDNGQAE